MWQFWSNVIRPSRPAGTPGRVGAFRPRLEVLGDRLCPSCTVTASGGTLTIIGDSGPNMVTVRDNNEADTLEVVCDGTTKPFGPADQIQKIEVDLKGGTDTFRYQLAGGSDFIRARDVTVLLGSGDTNAAQFYLDTDGTAAAAVIKAPLTIDVRGDASQEYTGATRDLVD